MKQILVLASLYYREIGEMLIVGATDAIDAAGHPLQLLVVPGALEIPVAASIAHASGRYAGYVALGCVLRGETTHYDTVAQESARGLMDFAMRTQSPVGNGILTCETMEQAQVRADTAQGNKGWHAASACIQLMTLRQTLGLDPA
jgi:6,7-dimethyl-8-ribityllumazine synthase